jgi:hypothetical protein
LIAAATLMLAIMFVAAASLPYINVDISPSSEEYKRMQDIVMNSVRDIITGLSALQCAMKMVDKNAAAPQEEIGNLRYSILKQILGQLENIKFKETKVEVNIDRADISANWDVNSKKVVASLNVSVAVSIELDGKKYKYDYKESLTVIGTGDFGESQKFLDSQKFELLVEAVARTIGAVPIVGIDFNDKEGISKIKQYSQHAIALQIDKYMREFTTIEPLYSSTKLATFTPKDLSLMMVLDILNRPQAEVSKISTKGGGGWETYSKVSWNEYIYLDWVAIGTVNVLDIVPLGKVAKSGGGMVKTVIGAGDTVAFNVGQIRDEWWSYFVNNKQFGRVDSLEPPIAVSIDYLKYSNAALKPLTKEKIKEAVKLQLSTTNTTAVLNWVRTFDDFLTNRLKADNWAYLEDPDPLLLIGIPLDNAIFTACVWLNGVAYRPAGGK